MPDVVIIGSGAGGAPLALRLSQAGCRVLVLEKGPRHARADYVHDEVFRATRPGFFIPEPDEDPHVLVRETDEAPARTLTTLGWIARCVGGGTEHMGGSFYRFHPDDLRLGRRFGPFASIADWPWRYGELEPYYSQAEWEMGVSGTGGLNPFEGPRSRDYPMPPLEDHPMAWAFDAACDRLGLHAFPTPRAINSRPYLGRPACAYCRFCAGYGCAVGARGSAQEALLPRAEQTGRCEVRANAMVSEILVNAAGRASGCIFIDASGARHQVKADLVCICCSAVESARLLLLSASARFPQGLGNRHGLVGRHLQFQCISVARARFRHDRHPGMRLRREHGLLLRSLMDHYFLPPGAAALPKGGVLKFELERREPIATAQKLAVGGPGPVLWGEPLRARLRDHFHACGEVKLEAFHDFVPNDRTFANLDSEVTDKWGLPAACIHLANPEHHRQAGQWLMARGLEVLEALGADEILTERIADVNGAMAHGTCRAGVDPERSVLNRFCEVHDVPNLFVVDGSFLPTSGGCPSTLTIAANSLRVADYILSRRGAG